MSHGLKPIVIHLQGVVGSTVASSRPTQTGVRSAEMANSHGLLVLIMSGEPPIRVGPRNCDFPVQVRYCPW